MKIKKEKRWKEERLRELVKYANSKADILRGLELTIHRGNYKTLEKYIKLWGINISHINGNSYAGKMTSKKTRIPTKEILVEDSTYGQSDLKKRIIKEKIIEHKCQKCGLEHKWENEKLVLQLDHINENHTDNRKENLRFLCPNCHSQTPTFSRSKVKVKVKIKKNKCIDCNVEIKRKTSKRCKKCSAKINGKKCRKVKNRPSIEILKKDIEEYGYKGTGRKYGVSDNSIRKWIKNN